MGLDWNLGLLAISRAELRFHSNHPHSYCRSIGEKKASSPVQLEDLRVNAYPIGLGRRSVTGIGQPRDAPRCNIIFNLVCSILCNVCSSFACSPVCIATPRVFFSGSIFKCAEYWHTTIVHV